MSFFQDLVTRLANTSLFYLFLICLFFAFLFSDVQFIFICMWCTLPSPVTYVARDVSFGYDNLLHFLFRQAVL